MATNDKTKPAGQKRKRRSTGAPSRVRSVAAAERPAKTSAKQAAVQVLKRAHGPLHVKEIAERVMKMDDVSGLKGKTPEATIAAMLSVENGKKDGLFKRVEKGTYELREQKPSSSGGNGNGGSKPEPAKS